MIMKLHTKTVLTMLAMLFTSAAYTFDDVKVTSTAVTEDIHMLAGKGGNVGVFVGKDGTFIIDDQFAPLTEKLMAAIKSVGQSE